MTLFMELYTKLSTGLVDNSISSFKTIRLERCVLFLHTKDNRFGLLANHR